MLRCIAVDDEPLALDVIKSYSEKLSSMVLVKTFTSTNRALEYLAEHPVDLLFLDIELPGANGISFYKSLGRKLPVIFTTAYSDYAVEGFNVDAVDYLLKPIDENRFCKAVEKASELVSLRLQNPDFHGKSLSVRADYQLVQIPFEDILYIEGLNDYVQIYRVDQPPVLSLIPLKTILQKLPAQSFKRIHRSYIIPVSRVTSYYSRRLQIGDKVIPIGDTYREEVKEIFRPA